MKYIGKYGYVKIQSPGSMTWKSHSRNEALIYNLYFVDINIDFSQDTFDSKKILVYFITYLMKFQELEEVIKSNEYNKKLFNSCLDRILNSKYIAIEDKEEIRRRASKFINCLY